MAGYIEYGQTSDGRTVTIEQQGSNYVLKSNGSAPVISANLDYLKQEFDRRVPNDSAHRKSGFGW